MAATETASLMHRRRFGAHSRRPNASGAHSSIYLVCGMMLFATLAEGMVSFIVPLRIEEAGFSDTMLGVIIGTSSIAGAVFDLVACRLFKNTFYKRIFGLMLLLALLLPVLILKATTFFMFVVCMAIWGVYYDLRNIGNFDYVARTTASEDNTRAFGLIQVFQSIGWVLGPIIVGLLVGEAVDWRPVASVYVFLAIAALFFAALWVVTGDRRAKEHQRKEKECRRGTWSEVRMMGQVGLVLFPALLSVFFLNFADSFFWSIGPLFAEELGLGAWSGLLLTAWSLPPLLIGWHAGRIARKYGKEGLAYLAQLASAACLMAIPFLAPGIAVLGGIFIAASCAAVAFPTIQSLFADCIREREDLAKEIEGLEDLYTNLGYVFGPILAGVLSDTFGYSFTFGILGGVVALSAIFLITHHARKPLAFQKEAPPLICDI